MKGTEIDWESVREELDTQEWEDDLFDNEQTRAVFLGTVFALFPSGKYWTCWTSNATERERKADLEYADYLLREAEKIGASIESGEGDPCDIFVVEYR
jgi:hypothetical protein